jgi:PAS domain-containing protein
MTDGEVHRPGLLQDGVAHLGASLISTVPDAVVYADRDGIIRLWNSRRRFITGLPV